ncbi:MAG: SMP-30/gluconolactonase/LRE family protein, partial [Anaerolineales bacterium]|nr:SMP-30/gluconolactonase/LRE family protein [Anaerolineales bacterium]
RFNDAAVDRLGRFFFAGTMNEKKPMAATGALYRMDTQCRVTTLVTGVTVSNGIGWSPDNRLLYYTDTQTQKTFVYDYDTDSGDLSNRRVFAEYPVEMGFPDGLTVDRDGCVWVAFFGGWQVARYDPQGREMAAYRLPVANVTSVAFGGAGLDVLDITSARTGLSEAQRKEQPEAGDLFALATDTQGYAEPLFNG